MRSQWAVRAATALLLFGGSPCRAQQSLEGWRLLGTLGMNLSNTNSALLEPPAGSSGAIEQSTAAGDLRLNLDAFLKDPRLLPFTLDFNGQQGSNRVDVGGFHNTLLSGGVNAVLLPERPAPLRLFYRKSQFGSIGRTFTEDTDSSALGLDWALRLSKLPRVNLGFNRSSNDVRLPTSINDASYRQNVWHLGADDEWRKWEWSLGFDGYSNVSTCVGGFGLPSGLRDNLRVLGLRLVRPFWDKKAQLALENRSQWRNGNFPGQTTLEGWDDFTHANLRVAHSPKLSSGYYYSFIRVRLSSTGAPGALPGGLGALTLFVPPAFASHLAGGRAQYRLANSLGVFQEIRYYLVTPPSSQFEARRSLTESLSGASYHKTWRGMGLSGNYVAHWQLLGSNLGNRANTFSNDVQAQAAWGDIRRVRLLGGFRHSKLNLVEQLGGFSEDRGLRVEAETARVPRLRLRFSADRSRIELLNISGDMSQVNTGLGLQIEHARFSLGLTRLLSDGAGEIFPEAIRFRRLISVPLPLDELVATPLLNRTARANAATLNLRLLRQLDVSAYWRTERDLFALSNLNYRLGEARARYRLGKFTFEAGVGKYRTEVLADSRRGGTDITRLFLRAARDFRLF